MPQNQTLSTKDALYIEDMLAWNLLAAKKTHHAASACQLPALKAQLEACCQMHSQHYRQLSQFLSGTAQSSTTVQ
ncbi:hypothetical protein [Jeotgalibacillus soli]|uniref:Spore coat protein n=1 Tax=Jeotgalibacillus soli TaxID=889306 RepID=A0A0C2VF80_9BACL|nr:hypothetical protein [Jeotgalibacillus soli]KIL42668.1 hypothetical protein KP78_38910 [Jeotgalibacillus soli]